MISGPLSYREFRETGPGRDRLIPERALTMGPTRDLQITAQIVVYTKYRQNVILLQIIFCSWVLVTTPFREKLQIASSSCQRECQTWWSNDKKLLNSIIEKSCVSQINYLPQNPQNSSNIWIDQWNILPGIVNLWCWKWFQRPEAFCRDDKLEFTPIKTLSR